MPSPQPDHRERSAGARLLLLSLLSLAFAALLAWLASPFVLGPIAIRWLAGHGVEASFERSWFDPLAGELRFSDARLRLPGTAALGFDTLSLQLSWHNGGSGGPRVKLMRARGARVELEDSPSATRIPAGPAAEMLVDAIDLRDIDLVLAPAVPPVRVLRLSATGLAGLARAGPATVEVDIEPGGGAAWLRGEAAWRDGRFSFHGRLRVVGMPLAPWSALVPGGGAVVTSGAVDANGLLTLASGALANLEFEGVVDASGIDVALGGATANASGLLLDGRGTLGWQPDGTVGLTAAGSLRSTVLTLADADGGTLVAQTLRLEGMLDASDTRMDFGGNVDALSLERLHAGGSRWRLREPRARFQRSFIQPVWLTLHDLAAGEFEFEPAVPAAGALRWRAERAAAVMLQLARDGNVAIDGITLPRLVRVGAGADTARADVDDLRIGSLRLARDGGWRLFGGEARSVLFATGDQRLRLTKPGLGEANGQGLEAVTLAWLDVALAMHEQGAHRSWLQQLELQGLRVSALPAGIEGELAALHATAFGSEQSGYALSGDALRVLDADLGSVGGPRLQAAGVAASRLRWQPEDGVVVDVRAVEFEDVQLAGGERARARVARAERIGIGARGNPMVVESVGFSDLRLGANEGLRMAGVRAASVQIPLARGLEVVLDEVVLLDGVASDASLQAAEFSAARLHADAIGNAVLVIEQPRAVGAGISVAQPFAAAAVSTGEVSWDDGRHRLYARQAAGTGLTLSADGAVALEAVGVEAGSVSAGHGALTVASVDIDVRAIAIADLQVGDDVTAASMEVAGMEAAVVREVDGRWLMPTAWPGAAGDGRRLTVESLRVGAGSSLQLTDQAVTPPVLLQAEQVTLVAHGIDTLPPRRVRGFDGSALVDGGSRLLLSGSLGVGGDGADATLSARIAGLPLQALAGYLAELGLGAGAGTLDLAATVELAGERLLADADIALHDYTARNVAVDADATLATLLGLLRDEDGVTRIGVDLQHDLTRSDEGVVDAFTAALARAARAGLSPALQAREATADADAGVVATGVRLLPLAFAAGSAVIEAPAREQLVALANRLLRAPGLGVQPCGVATPGDEAEPLGVRSLAPPALAAARVLAVREQLQQHGVAGHRLLACEARSGDGAGRVELRVVTID